jgi:hypothetical protein
VSRVYDILSARLEEERRTRPVPLTAADIPLGFESITPAWLTQVLCAAHPGATITACTLGPPDEGTSSRRRLHLAYDEAGRRADLPTSVFCKATHTLTSRLRIGIVGFIVAEVNFYHHLRPLLDIEAPECLFANVDEHTYNSIILLRDMTDDAHFCGHAEPMSRARLEDQLALLAILHGRFHAATDLPARFPFLRTWDDIFTSTAEAGYRRVCLRGFQMAEEQIPARMFARAAEVFPATIASALRHRELPRTIIHSDVHLKNWYVTADGRMGLGDWQCVCLGHWSRDLAYCVSTALDTVDRRAWERELVAFYLDRLHAAGGPRVAFDSAWREYREQLLGALAWWTGTLGQPADKPDMQPPESSRHFIGRIARAIDDLDALDLAPRG